MSIMFVLCLGIAAAVDAQETPAATSSAVAPPVEASSTPPVEEGQPEAVAQEQRSTLAFSLRPEGGTVWSVWYGYGFNHVVNNSAPEIDISSVGIRWAHLWAERGSGFLRGHPSVAVELIPMNIFLEDSQSTWAGGLNLLYEHHFAVRGRVLPVCRFGAGFLYSSREIPEGETEHNFSLLAALGLDILVTPTTSLLLEYRFHHMSNANTGYRNPGINAHTVIFGLSFFR